MRTRNLLASLAIIALVVAAAADVSAQNDGKITGASHAVYERIQ